MIVENSLVFFLVKMCITASCLLICYRFSHLRTARIGIRFVVALYLMVSVYHVLILVHG